MEGGPTTEQNDSQQLPVSEERLLDAAEIEALSKSLTRPTAKQHLELLVGRLRRDATALKRAEGSASEAEKETAAKTEATTTLANTAQPIVPKSPPNVIVTGCMKKYISIANFAFDVGSYNSQYVTLYTDLPAVGSIPRDQISCTFTPLSVDLVVTDLGGKNYRLFRDNLDKEIDPDNCKYIVKKEKIVIKLCKKKGEYGSYDHWSDLTAKKKKKAGAEKADPSAGIMDMMKEMYDSGDDKMKKMIGETMMKQQRGEMGKDLNDDFGKV